MNHLSGSIFTILAISVPLCLVLAQDDGTGSMDGMSGMDMGGVPLLAHGNMIPYLHFTRGDTLWFEGWVPQTAGSVAGACIGLFLLGIVDRLLAATRSSAESFWSVSSNRFIALHKTEDYKPISSEPKPTPDHPKNPSLLIAARTILSARFVPSHDVVRGMIHASQVALGFLFMLAIMTYNVAFIISIVVGMGLGETLFGRLIRTSSGH